ncbi:hypothetical protein JXQ70_10825 [bacterium]|nr:hypothetical protein [bacterium]
MKERIAVKIGGILMALLGIIRGTGGLILIIQKGATDPAIIASGSSITTLGILLFILGAMILMTGIGFLFRKLWAWYWGLWLMPAFVIDGALNGYVLYGQPGILGTAANICVAALIVLCLILSRTALEHNPTSHQNE